MSAKAPLPSPVPMAREQRPISMVLVDDCALARGGVVARIRAEPGFQVLATSARVEVAVKTVRETTPDVVLLNLPETGDDGLTLAGALHGEVVDSRVIVMGLEPDRDVVRLVRAGVSGFLMSGASFDDVLHTVHSVAQGVQVLPVELTHSLFAQLARPGMPGHPKQRLTARRLTGRQQQVADLMARGLNNREIARRLQISLRTTKSHVRKVLSKLAVNSRLEVAALMGLGPHSFDLAPD